MPHASKNSTCSQLIRRCLLAAGAAASLAASVKADVYGYDHGGNDRMWGVNFMPDLDQVREEAPIFGIDGLTPVNGTMHCVPTSISNIAAYMTWRGLGPWSQSMNWTSSQANIYNTATAHIQDLGDIMGTDDGGTSYDGMHDGASTLFDGIPYDVNTFLTDGEGPWAWAPKTADFAGYGLSGGLMAFCFGRYDWHWSGQVVVEDRTSGHCLTLTRATVNPNGINEIRFRDPGSGGNTSWTQSAYSEATRVAQDFWVNHFGVNRWMTVIVDPDGLVEESEQVRLIDGVTIIWPAWFLLDPPNSGGSITIEPNPTHSNPGSAMLPSVPLVAPSTTFPPIDFAMQPDRSVIAHAFRISPTVCGVETRHVIDGAVSPMITFPDVRGMVYGRFMDLYILTNTEIVRCSTRSGVTVILQRLVLPTGGDRRAIAYDDQTDRLLILNVNQSRLERYSYDFQGNLPSLLLTSSIAPVLTPATGATFSLAVGSGTGDVWIANDLAHRVVHAGPLGPDMTALQSIFSTTMTPTDVQLDSRKRLLIASGNGILEYTDRNNDGTYETAPSIYSGMRPHRKFEITTSRSNANIPRDQVPGWRNLLIPDEFADSETADCRADFDGNGIVDSGDFFAFLGEFFEGSFSADFDSNGTVDSSDFFSYLSEFFAGCQVIS